jgi:hypothetical protein
MRKFQGNQQDRQMWLKRQGWLQSKQGLSFWQKPVGFAAMDRSK